VGFLVVDTDVASLIWRDALPAELELQAGARGQVVPADDCWIAACCVVHALPLLSRNRKHFEPLEAYGLELL
jgi:predicted nucleic acid-binding protein